MLPVNEGPQRFELFVLDGSVSLSTPSNPFERRQERAASAGLDGVQLRLGLVEPIGLLVEQTLAGKPEAQAIVDALTSVLEDRRFDG